jgi:hypothetical protein
LGGGVLIPSVIQGAIQAPAGIGGGWRGVGREFWRGFKSPVSVLAKGTRARYILNQGTRRGVTPEQVKFLKGFSEDLGVVPEVAKALVPRGTRGLQAIERSGLTPEQFSALPLPVVQEVRNRLRREMGEVGMAMAMAGGVTGASAGMQYAKGRSLGEQLTADQRIRLLQEPSEANKTAAMIDETGEGAAMTPLQSVAVGTAAASPFAGLIGQKKIIHDPLQGAQGQRFRSMKELQAAAKPGDVLMTTKPKGSLWKNFIAPFSGSEFYHAQPVVGRRAGQGTTATAGEFNPSVFEKFKPKDIIREDVDEIAKAMRGEYPDVALLRPKNLSAAARKEVAERSMGRAVKNYDTVQAIKGWLKDVFVPKIPGLEKLGPQTICEGNVCSTVSSQALHDVTGRSVVPGKAAKDIMPPDFLRSSEYELVGSKVDPSRYRMSPALRKAAPYLTRGAIGLGLGGLAYGATEEPELIGAGAGAYGAGKGMEKYLAKRLGDKRVWKEFPLPFDTLEAMMDPSRKNRWQKLRRFGGRRLPVVAAGGLLGYGAAKGLKHLFSDDEDSKGNEGSKNNSGTVRAKKEELEI